MRWPEASTGFVNASACFGGKCQPLAALATLAQIRVADAVLTREDDGPVAEEPAVGALLQPLSWAGVMVEVLDAVLPRSTVMLRACGVAETAEALKSKSMLTISTREIGLVLA
jgi:hypothetical protein